jgi:hypothetical protein
MCPETDHRHLKPASPQKHHGLRRSREILIGEEQPAAASGSASGTHRDLSSQPVPHRYLAASCGGHSIPALIPHPIHPSIRLLIMTLNGLIRRCGCQTARASEGQGSGSSPSPGSHPLGRVARRPDCRREETHLCEVAHTPSRAHPGPRYMSFPAPIYTAIFVASGSQARCPPSRRRGRKCRRPLTKTALPRHSGRRRICTGGALWHSIQRDVISSSGRCWLGRSRWAALARLRP